MSIAPLTMRQRLALVVGTSISAETVLGMDDEEFTSEFLQAHGVCAPLLKAARITPIQLKARGVRTARDFHSLEFDTLDLVDGAFCAACVSAFGAEDLLQEFLVTANDAVTLSGTAAMHQLGIDIGTLLMLCAGEPALAAEVISQTTPRGSALNGVAPETLLDTGLRSQQLAALGYDTNALARQARCTEFHLKLLGF